MKSKDSAKEQINARSSGNGIQLRRQRSLLDKYFTVYIQENTEKISC